MKLIRPIFICLALMFIGCGGSETPIDDDTDTPNDTFTFPTANGGEEETEESPQERTPNLESSVASQTVLTCSKKGANDVVYTAKTYASPQPCKKDEGLASVRSCVCEIFVDGNVLFMATNTSNWCENEAIDDLINKQGITVYGSRGAEFVSASHDASYTCTSS